MEVWDQMQERLRRRWLLMRVERVRESVGRRLVEGSVRLDLGPAE